ALSDALGIHMSEESENKHTEKEIWQSTISTLVSKFFFALIFAFPLLVLDLHNAIIANIVLGLSLLTVFSYQLAKEQNKKPTRVIIEHLAIAIVVIVLTRILGSFINSWLS
ncbi:MAG: hypothetical protein QXM75_03295, partial [Candidatus Diapherotrites archaeon]